MSSVMRRNLNQPNRGVALLMVLATLALLSGIIVEFAYNTNVTYNLAMNDLDRVQAYYLAESGINFSKLILKYDQEAQQMAKQASQKLGKNFQIQPLYEMIPINTALFRGLTGMTPSGEESQGEPPPETGAEGEEGEGPSALEQGMAMINTKAAQDFLAFNGDFSAEIKEEDAKLNLNGFFTLSPQEKSYDRLKSTLYHLLVTDEFKGLFDDRFRGAKELAQNIADFIDKDEVHNEAGGEERGREVVRGQDDTSMKNGKLISLEELALVPGMTDPIFQKLKQYVTIYGGDEKIWVCRAEEPLVKALILAYTENNPRMEPIPDDNAELLQKALDAVLNSCPDLASMAKELDSTLGVVAQEDAGSSPEPAPKTKTETKEGQTTQGQSPQKSTSQNFKDLVKENGTIYSVIGTGTVGESEVRLVTILDTSKGAPANWKQLYWRVE